MKKILALLCEVVNTYTNNILIENGDKQKWYNYKTGTIVEL